MSRQANPRFPRFEVECIPTRKNSVISLEGDCVVIYDTTRGAGNAKTHAFSPGGYSFNCETAEELYKYLYNKSLKNSPEQIYFIGYVDGNFEPIDENESDL